jgi:trimethylamine--corrinoid protein Co-methyltransferase
MRPKLNMLDPSLIEQIIEESKSVLAEVGIEVRGEALKQRLIDAGLPTDIDGKRILFPPETVNQAIAAAPSSFTLYDRDGRPHATLGGDAVHFVPASSGLNILDYRSGETRLANTTDFVEYVRLANGLEHIDYLATAFSTNDDIDAAVSDAWRLYLCLTNSKKPVVSGAFTEHGVTRMAEMMALFRADKADLKARPMSLFTITATGNFRYSEDSCQNLLDCVEWGIPVEIVPVTLMGLIAPVTLVGACVFHTVDTLAGITMAQLLRPGTPVVFGGAPASFHMSEATSPMLGIGALRLDVAYAAIGKHLGLPTQSYMALSDAKTLDAQAGAETFASALMAGLAGINSVSGPGMLDYVLTFCLPKLVFDNEICGQVQSFLAETRIVDDLPTIDLVRAQLAEEHMITAPHTLAHWPEHLYMPGPTWDRKSRDNWISGGSKNLWTRAVEEVETRLAAYQPVETDPAIDAEMRRLIVSDMKTGRPLPEVPSAGTPVPTQSREEMRSERRAARRAHRARR